MDMMKIPTGTPLSEVSELHGRNALVVTEFQHKGQQVSVVRYTFHYPDDHEYYGVTDGKIVQPNHDPEGIIRWLGHMMHEESST